MYSNMNEDVMWQRLQDLQREAENARLDRPRLLPTAWRAAGSLGRRAWGWPVAAFREAAWALRRGVAPRWWA